MTLGVKYVMFSLDYWIHSKEKKNVAHLPDRYPFLNYDKYM